MSLVWKYKKECIYYALFCLQNVLAPLCLAEITDFLLLRMGQWKTKSPPGLFAAVLLLSGVPPQKIAPYTLCLHLMTRLGQDACVYIFSFVTFHALVDWQQGADIWMLRFSILLRCCTGFSTVFTQFSNKGHSLFFLLRAVLESNKFISQNNKLQRNVSVISFMLPPNSEWATTFGE